MGFLSLEFSKAGFVGFTEFADSLVADLADALALQIHVFGYLRHRLVLLIDAEEGVHHPTLPLVERCQRPLDSRANSMASSMASE